MSLATVGRHTTPPLPDLLDALAARTGSWVLVDQFGSVLGHGTGGFDCPPALAQTLLSKSAEPLRSAVRWSRSGPLVRGRVENVELFAADLGDGATAWFIGGTCADLQDAKEMLAAAVHDNAAPVRDLVVEELLHPRGLTRPGQAPASLLLLLRTDTSLTALGRSAMAVTAGTSIRVHVEDHAVVLALPVQSDGAALVAALRSACPDVIGGMARVAEGASDWVTAARLAAGACLAAQSLGRALGDPDDPAIAAELVVQEAQAAAAELLRLLGDGPLQRLRAHDDRTSGDLIASLTAWCRAGFDVPAAAGYLHVHVNTLRYRLKRAGEVSGLDLSRPRQLLALQLLLAV